MNIALRTEKFEIKFEFFKNIFADYHLCAAFFDIIQSLLYDFHIMKIHEEGVYGFDQFMKIFPNLQSTDGRTL